MLYSPMQGKLQRLSARYCIGFSQDESLKQKWIHAIKRKNFVPSKTSKVNF